MTVRTALRLTVVTAASSAIAGGTLALTHGAPLLGALMLTFGLIESGYLALTKEA